MIEIRLQPDMPHDLPEVAEHEPVEFVCGGPAGARLALAVGGEALEPFLRPGELAWRWRWNPGPAVGLHDVALTVEPPGGPPRRAAWRLRVVPRKIEQERYQALLADVERAVRGLALALGGASAEGAALLPPEAGAADGLDASYALIAGHLPPLARAVRRIAARPRECLAHATAPVPLGQARALDAGALREVAGGELAPAPAGVAPELQEAVRPGGGLLPERVPVPRSAVSYDIYEHRLLRRVLLAMLRRACLIGEAAERTVVEARRARAARARAIAAGCAAAARELRALLALPFLAEVGPLAVFVGPTPLLQRDPVYREVYRAWQALRRRPFITFDSPLITMPIADLPLLYERWCALQAAEALLALGGTVRAQRLVALHRAEGDLELSVALVEDEPLLEIERGDRRLVLRYQPRYRPEGGGLGAEEGSRSAECRVRSSESETQHPATSSQRPELGTQHPALGSLDRYTHVPDLAIEVWPAGQPPRVLLIDAKYRLASDGRGVPPDALADAYTYLGAIGAGGARATLGALLLYPGSGPAEVFRSGVAAAPLLPGQVEALREYLAALLG
jgi:large subunit ribosomal protein MRP49